MSVYEMAEKYYPRLWNAERIRALLAAGRLTGAEAAAILGEAADEVTPPDAAADEAE